MDPALESEQQRNWDYLPDDIVQVVAAHLPCQDVAAARQCCKAWRRSFGCTARYLHICIPTTAAGPLLTDAVTAVPYTMQQLCTAFPHVTHLHLHVGGSPPPNFSAGATAPGLTQQPASPRQTTSSSSSSVPIRAHHRMSGTSSSSSTCVGRWPQVDHPGTPVPAVPWPRVHALSVASALSVLDSMLPTAAADSNIPDAMLPAATASSSRRASWDADPRPFTSSTSTHSRATSRDSSSSSGSERQDTTQGSATSSNSDSRSSDRQDATRGRSKSPDSDSSSSCCSGGGGGPGLCAGSCRNHEVLQLVALLLQQLQGLTGLRGLALTADPDIGELPCSALTTLTQLQELVLLACYPPLLLPKLTAHCSRLRQLQLGFSTSNTAAGVPWTNTAGSTSSSAGFGVSSGGTGSSSGSSSSSRRRFLGVTHTTAQLSALSWLSGSLQQLVLPGLEMGPVLPVVGLLTQLTSLVVVPTGRNQGMQWRGLLPAHLASLSTLQLLQDLTLPAVIYDSTMTYIRRVPKLAAAYDAALTAALTGMPRLLRMRYILGCCPSNALLQPLSAAAGLQVLQLEGLLQLEAISRRQAPWMDDTPPLTEQGCSWLLRLRRVELLLPVWSSSLAALQPLLLLPNLVTAELGPSPMVSEPLLHPLSKATGLQTLTFQRVAFTSLGEEGALTASRALSQLLLTLPRLVTLKLQLVEGEWQGGSLVTDEVLMALRCTAKGLEQLVYEVAAVQKRSPWWAAVGTRQAGGAQLSEVGLSALLTHPSVTSVTLVCPITLRQPRWYSPTTSSSHSTQRSSSSMAAVGSTSTWFAAPAVADGSSRGTGVASQTGQRGQTSQTLVRPAPVNSAPASRLRHLVLCLAVEPLSPAAAAAASYLRTLKCPAAGAAYKAAWRHRGTQPGAVVRYRFPSESMVLDQLPPSLTHLTLQLPGLKDTYLQQLAARCPELRHLTLYAGTSALTPHGLQQLTATVGSLEKLVLLLPPQQPAGTVQQQQQRQQQQQQQPKWLQQLMLAGGPRALARSSSTSSGVMNGCSSSTANIGLGTVAAAVSSSNSSSVPLPAGMDACSGPRVQLLQLVAPDGDTSYYYYSGSASLTWDASGQSVKPGSSGSGVVYLTKGPAAVADVTQLYQQQQQEVEVGGHGYPGQQQQQQLFGLMAGKPSAMMVEDIWAPPSAAGDAGGVTAGDAQHPSDQGSAWGWGATSNDAAPLGATTSSGQHSSNSIVDIPAPCHHHAYSTCSPAVTGGSSSQQHTTTSCCTSSSNKLAWLVGKPGWQYLLPEDFGPSQGCSHNTSHNCSNSNDGAVEAASGGTAAGGCLACPARNSDLLGAAAAGGRQQDSSSTVAAHCAAFLGDYVGEDCGISLGDPSECSWLDL